MPASPAASEAPRVVLDSNVWIDILVFDDPHTRPIRAALESGALRATIDARCAGELARVLDYPHLLQRGIDKAHALATVARLAQTFEAAADAAPLPALPQCKDRDDQKFVELAYACGAAWLVTKDRALLKLARRTARDFGFRIAEPAPFVAECGLGTSGDQTAHANRAAQPT